MYPLHLGHVVVGMVWLVVHCWFDSCGTRKIGHGLNLFGGEATHNCDELPISLGSSSGDAVLCLPIAQSSLVNRCQYTSQQVTSGVCG
jgi:hypothetical protein